MQQFFARYGKVHVFFAVSNELIRNIMSQMFVSSCPDGGAFDKTHQIVYFSRIPGTIATEQGTFVLGFVYFAGFRKNIGFVLGAPSYSRMLGGD